VIVITLVDGDGLGVGGWYSLSRLRAGLLGQEGVCLFPSKVRGRANHRVHALFVTLGCFVSGRDWNASRGIRPSLGFFAPPPPHNTHTHTQNVPAVPRHLATFSLCSVLCFVTTYQTAWFANPLTMASAATLVLVNKAESSGTGEGPGMAIECQSFNKTDWMPAMMYWQPGQ
jgi:hypothetical protein